MKKIFTKGLLGILMFTGSVALGQQDAQYTHNMFNKVPINAAAAGAQDAICGVLIGRNQWVGFEGAPQTALLAMDMPLGWLPFMPFDGGVGLTVLGDKLGFDRSMYVKAAFNYRRDLGNGKLSAGLDLGMLQKALDGTALSPIDAGDPNIPTSKVKDVTYDLGFGLYYYTNKLYFGLSSSHLPEQTVNFEALDLTLARHYYIMAGYDYDLNANITLKPSVFIKTDASSTQLDVNALAEYNKLFWGGVSYRVQDAIAIMVGADVGQFIDIPGLKFGYSYDITTSRIKGYSSGTHEIMLKYCFKLPPKFPPQRHGNTRFLPQKTTPKADNPGAK